jgi:hypothetical protein
LVRVPLDAPEIDGLIRLKLLRKERRQDHEALQGAVMGLIYRVLDNNVPGAAPLVQIVTVTRLMAIAALR